MAGSTGLEPATSGLTERYAPSTSVAFLATSHTYKSGTAYLGDSVRPLFYDVWPRF